VCCLNSKVFMFARETVRTFYKGVRSSSKGFVTVERLCGRLISFRSTAGLPSQDQIFSGHFPEEIKQALNN